MTNFFDRIENSKYPLWSFLLLFLVFVQARNIIEPLSTGYGWNLSAQTMYLLWYVGVAIYLIPIVKIVTGDERIGGTIKIVSVCSVLLIMPPVLDIFLTGGYKIEFFMPGKDDLGERYLYALIVQGREPGLSNGQRIEIITILLVSLCYLYSKTRSVWKALFGGFCLYNLLFLFGSLSFIPYWLSVLSGAGLPNDQSVLMIKLLVLLFFPGANLLLFSMDRRLYREVLKNFRWLRIGHYVLSMLFGLVLSGAHRRMVVAEDMLNFGLVLAAIVCAALFAIITNDLHDVHIDRISNPHRPLVRKSIPPGTYRQLSRFSLGLAVLFSATAGWVPLAVISAVTFFYQIYSVPPLRVKRIFWVSKMLIAANTLLIIWLGFLMGGGRLANFPIEVALFVMIAVAACINFIDIKDYYGDKEAGIKTLPTWIGLEKSKKLIGLFFIVTYCIVPFVFARVLPVLNGTYFYLLSIVNGLLLYGFIVKRKYNELPVFFLYEASYAAIIFTAIIDVRA